MIEHVSPAVDGGLFPAKTSVGDVVPIEADVFTDGHDLPAARVLIRHEDADRADVPMVPLGNDHWRCVVAIEYQGTYRFRVEGWIDSWATWRFDLEKRLAAGQDVAVDLKEGAGIVGGAA
ncbi:MAG TPA: maltotransferase domain-containing protein, partial [Actinomycetota bacterium]|nr:maltotransferase domain-containing protein [Actinomycetota bacterium]